MWVRLELHLMRPLAACISLRMHARMIRLLSLSSPVRPKSSTSGMLLAQLGALSLVRPSSEQGLLVCISVQRLNRTVKKCNRSYSFSYFRSPVTESQLLAAIGKGNGTQVLAEMNVVGQPEPVEVTTDGFLDCLEGYLGPNEFHVAIRFVGRGLNYVRLSL